MNITDEKFVLYYHTNPVVEYLTPDLEDGTVLHVSVRLIPDWTTPSMCDAEGTVANGKVTFTLNTFTEEFQRVCRDYDMAYLEVYEDDETRKVYLQRRIGIKARAGTLDGQPPSPTPDSYYTSAQIDEMFTHYYTSDQIGGILEIYYTSDQVDSLLETKEDVGVASTLVDEHNNNMDAHNGHLVPEYGNDRAVLVCDGGTASKWQYGDTYEVVITNTIKAKPNAIFEIDMYDNKTINIEPPIENDVDFGIVVMQGDVPYSITLSGVGCSILFPDQSDVPLYNESNLPQSVAGTNTAYMIHFHWDSYSKSLLSNVAYGVNMTPVYGTRGVFFKSGNTIVSSAMIVGTVESHTNKVEVYDGGRISRIGDNPQYGASLAVYSGGIVDNLVLYTSNNLYSGGVVNNLIGSTGMLRASGGTINTADGALTVYMSSGGVLKSANIDNGSFISASYATLGSITGSNANISYDHSYAENVVNIGAQGWSLMTSSYTGYLNLEGAYVNMNGGTIASAYLTNSASIQGSNFVLTDFVFDSRSTGNWWKNASATHGIIRNGAYLGCDSNCVFEDIAVSSGGQYVQQTSTGACSDLKVYSGGSALIRYATDFKKLVVSGGQAVVQSNNISDVYIESAAQNDVFFGYNSSVSDMVVSGGYIDLIRNTSADNINGYNPTLFVIQNNTNINNMLMSGGIVTVVYNTAVSDATFSGCSTADFARNQSASNITFTDCTVDFTSNTTVSDITFINDTVIFMGAQSASNITFSGGTAEIANNHNMSGVTFNDVTVEFGSNHLYGVVVEDGNYDFGATPTTDVVMNGGAVLLNRPSPADGVIINGGTMTVDGMAVANNVVVGSNGSLCVNEMGLASNVTSETGATIIVAEGGTISYK